jgi:maleate isomerase
MAVAAQDSSRDTRTRAVVAVEVEARHPPVGVLALGEDRVVSQEIRAFLSDVGVEVLTTRVGMPATFTLEGFGAMGEAFRRGAASLSQRCSVVAVACASAAVAVGPARLRKLVAEGLSGAEVVEPITAYLESLEARSVKRIGLVTPYAAETHGALVELLAERGLTVGGGLRLRVPAGHAPSDVSPASIGAAVRGADHRGVEALVISCTALPTVQLLDDMESQLEIPVVTTNRALSESILRRLRDRFPHASHRTATPCD